MRLPSAPSSPSPRTDTGTIALSGRGSSPRATLNRRRAPATVARQTSLTVTAPSFLAPSTSSIIRECRTSVRFGPMGALSAEEGAGRSRSSPAASAARRSVPASRVAVARGTVAARAAERALRSDSPAPAASASAASRAVPGAGAALQGAGTAGTASGDVSNSRSATSTADFPSTRAWWIFATTPQRPP